jgi:hypothetical protein
MTMETSVQIVKDLSQLFNLTIIPIFVWIVRVEKKLTRIETIFNKHMDDKVG